MAMDPELMDAESTAVLQQHQFFQSDHTSRQLGAVDSCSRGLLDHVPDGEVCYF